MRAKIAKNAKGHALEDWVLELSEVETYLLYMQAVKEEEEEKKEKYEIIKILNDAWTKKFDNQFELLRLFVNKDMFKHLKDMEEIKGLEVEINEDNFLSEWDKLMTTIPEEYIVEEGPGVMDLLEKAPIDPEFEDMITGWVKSSRKLKE